MVPLKKQFMEVFGPSLWAAFSAAVLFVSAQVALSWIKTSPMTAWLLGYPAFPEITAGSLGFLFVVLTLILPKFFFMVPAFTWIAASDHYSKEINKLHAKLARRKKRNDATS